MLRELLAEVPLRHKSRAYGAPAMDRLRHYHTNAARWLERLPAEDADQVRGEVEALGLWLRQRSADKHRRKREQCPFRRKLDELATEPSGLSCRFRPLVEPFAIKVIDTVCDEADKVLLELRSYSERQHADVAPLVVMLDGLPADDSSPAGETAAERRGVMLKFRDDVLLLSKVHFVKLRALYQLHTGVSPLPQEDGASAWEQEFLQRLYVMLRRYVTFIGLDTSQHGLIGGNMHAAAPETVFAWLKEELGVQVEMFASPLNCYFSNFFSAFPDVDTPFGSQGSFFDGGVTPEGSFEVGPPYTEEVIELTAQRLFLLLNGSGTGPLSFVLFVPDWEGAGGLALLDGQAFARYRRTHSRDTPYLLALGQDHHYVSGIQFFADAGDDAARRYYVVPHNTRVYVLQNDAGAERWPFTLEREEQLLARLRPPPVRRKRALY